MEEAAKHLRGRADELLQFAIDRDKEAERYSKMSLDASDGAAACRTKAAEFRRAADTLDPPAETAPAQERAA